MAKQNNLIATIKSIPNIMVGGEPIVNGLAEIESNGKMVVAYKDTYTDKKGTLCSFTCADPELVEYLSLCRVTTELDKALALKKFYAYYKVMENYKSFGQFTSESDFMETVYNVKGDTAKAYAMVGKYFLKKDDNGNIVYASELLDGASTTNMLQCLSMVDKESDNPLHDILDYITSGKLHITGTLAQVKRDIHDIKTDLGTMRKSGKKSGNKSGSDDKEKETFTVADAFRVLLAQIDNLSDDNKEKATSLIDELSNILG